MRGDISIANHNVSLFGKRGRTPDPIQVGGYDQPRNHQVPGHETVSLEDSKPLPAQPVREIGQDVIMGNGGDIAASSKTQLAHQDDVIFEDLPIQQDKMLIREQHQVMSPNQMTPKETILDENRDATTTA